MTDPDGNGIDVTGEQCPPLSRGRALRVHVQRVERLAGSHEEPVPLGPAKRDVRAGFRETNAAERLAFRIPHCHAAIADIGARVAAAPHISIDVDADAVGGASYAVNHEIGELLLVSNRLAVGAQIEAEHDLAADDVDLLIVGPEADPFAPAPEAF